MKDITAKELKEKLDRKEDFLLLNVLPKQAFDKEHIRGSAHIPLKDENFIERVKKAAPSKSMEIIVYCASEDCDASDKAAEKLEEAGYTNVTDFSGGMEDWKEAGYHVAKTREAA